MPPITSLLAVLCMTLFAVNSLLCRMALAHGMGALTYTALRGLSAIAMLFVVTTLSQQSDRSKTYGKSIFCAGSWAAAFFLFAYMLCFSLALVNIPAGSGTLIINVSVQVAMLGYGLACGCRLSRQELGGFFLAFVGLALLVSSDFSVPSLWHAILIAMSGLSWGGYCLCGEHATAPIPSTFGNFFRLTPCFLCCLGYGVLYESLGDGVAVFSSLAAGALASALSYALWYRILPRYSLKAGAIVQLSVPVIAAILAVPVLHEALTIELAVAASLILGGIAMTLCAKKHG